MINKPTQATEYLKGTIILGDTLNIFHGLTSTHWLSKVHK